MVHMVHSLQNFAQLPISSAERVSSLQSKHSNELLLSHQVSAQALREQVFRWVDLLLVNRAFFPIIRDVVNHVRCVIFMYI